MTLYFVANLTIQLFEKGGMLSQIPPRENIHTMTAHRNIYRGKSIESIDLNSNICTYIHHQIASTRILDQYYWGSEACMKCKGMHVRLSKLLLLKQTNILMHHSHSNATFQIFRTILACKIKDLNYHMVTTKL